MTAPRCRAVVEGRGGARRHRFGAICGRIASGYVAPGHPRCGAHLTDRERLRVRAVLETERELRALRMMPVDDERGGAEDEREPCGHEDANGTPWTELADRHAAG